MYVKVSIVNLTLLLALGLVEDRMSGVRNKILVLSGKGGVGKSTVSCQMAYELASRGFQVGLLDVDICGPSVPRMFGLIGQEVHQVCLLVLIHLPSPLQVGLQST